MTPLKLNIGFKTVPPTPHHPAPPPHCLLRGLFNMTVSTIGLVNNIQILQVLLHFICYKQISYSYTNKCCTLILDLPVIFFDFNVWLFRQPWWSFSSIKTVSLPLHKLSSLSYGTYVYDTKYLAPLFGCLTFFNKTPGIAAGRVNSERRYGARAPT